MITRETTLLQIVVGIVQNRMRVCASPTKGVYRHAPQTLGRPSCCLQWYLYKPKRHDEPLDSFVQDKGQLDTYRDVEELGINVRIQLFKECVGRDNTLLHGN